MLGRIDTRNVGAGCDDTVGRILQAPSNAGTRRASLSSDSDSSETDYTRKPRRMEVRLAPHEQLELLDDGCAEHPEVATEVKALDDIAKGVVTDKRPSNFQDGDWLCGTCNEHNFRNRVECRGVVHLHQQKKGTKVGEILKLKDHIDRRGRS